MVSHESVWSHVGCMYCPWILLLVTSIMFIEMLANTGTISTLIVFLLDVLY